MSVTTENSTTGAMTGNNSTSTPYVLNFPLLDKNDLVVVLRNAAGSETTLTVDTQYTVDLTTGSFTTATAYDNTNKIIAYREMAQKQSATYVENDRFPAKVTETALDKTVMMIQQLARKVKRCLRFGDTNDEVSPLGALRNVFLFADGVGGLVGVDSSGMQDYINNLVPTAFPRGMITVANASARASQVPEFTGQLLYQRDTKEIFGATGTSAGNWTSFQVVAGNVGSGIITAAMLASTLDLSLKTLTMPNAFLTAAMLKADFLSSMTLKATPASADRLLLYDVSGSAFKAVTISALGSGGGLPSPIYAEYRTYKTITANIPFDDSKPQSTEGEQAFLTVKITPTTNAKRVLIRLHGNAYVATSAVVTAAVFRDSGADAVGATSSDTMTGSSPRHNIALEFVDSPGTTAEVTYKVNAGANTGNCYLNGDNSSRKLGDTDRWSITVQEIT